MKKLIFILATILTFNCYAQIQQTNNTLPGRNSEHIVKRMQLHCSGEDNPAAHIKKLNLLNTKSLVWKWDTIITFDILNSRHQRLTQICDTQGNVLIRTAEYWQTNAWVNYERYTYTYDTNGNMLTYIREQWQTNSWVNYGRATYTYDANGNMLTDIREQWQTNAWVNYSRYTYTYDTNGNSITGKYEKWQGNWQPDITVLNLYSNKNIIYNVDTVYRYQASYKSFTSGIPEIAANSNLIVYPNPATNNITIESSQQAVIEILNIQGQLIKSVAANVNKTNIDISALLSGVYLVEVKTEKEVVIRKFVKD